MTGRGGPKERPEETRGRRGRDGPGLGSGAGSPESQDRGEDAASRGREGEAEGRESTSRRRALHEAGEAEVGKGFKHKNVRKAMSTETKGGKRKGRDQPLRFQPRGKYTQSLTATSG